MKTRFILLTAAVATFSCGHKGGREGGGGAGAGSSGGTLPDNAPNVSGTFALGNETTRQPGTKCGYSIRRPVRFRRVPWIPMGHLLFLSKLLFEKHTYSLHVTKDFDLIGDISIVGTSPKTDAFVYQGGFGFDLGQIVIPVDQLDGLMLRLGI